MASDYSRNPLINPSKISSYNLPDDLWPGILKRLPVQTLIRFMRVSKSWKTLISSPFFITLQLQNNSTKPRPHLHLDQNGYPNSYHSQHGQVVDLPEQARRQSDHVSFVDVIHHGVICVAYKQNNNTPYSAILWNPSIRKHVSLPWPQLERPSDNVIRVLGFGVDSSKNDFKVLVQSNGAKGYPCCFWVLSLRGGIWRQLKPLASSLGQCYVIPKHQKSCYTNGTIYCVTFTSKPTSNGSFRYGLLLFDCEREEFKTMDLPEEVARVRASFGIPKLVVWNGLFSVLKWTGWSRRCFEVWVMEDKYDVASSWRKLHGERETVEKSSVLILEENMLLMDVEATNYEL